MAQLPCRAEILERAAPLAWNITPGPMLVYGATPWLPRAGKLTVKQAPGGT